MENVIIAPHVPREPANYAWRVMEIFAENLVRWKAGRPLPRAQPDPRALRTCVHAHLPLHAEEMARHGDARALGTRAELVEIQAESLSPLDMQEFLADRLARLVELVPLEPIEPKPPPPPPAGPPR